MLRKHLAIWGIFFGLFAMHASPALAHVLTSASATVGCSCGGSTLKVTASELTPGTDYTIDYTVTATPTSGSPITVSSSIMFTATAATETVKAKIPLGALAITTYSLAGSSNPYFVGQHGQHPVRQQPAPACATSPPPPSARCKARPRRTLTAPLSTPATTFGSALTSPQPESRALVPA